MSVISVGLRRTFGLIVLFIVVAIGMQMILPWPYGLIATPIILGVIIIVATLSKPKKKLPTPQHSTPSLTPDADQTQFYVCPH